MWRNTTWMALAFLAMAVVGCGGSDEPETRSKVEDKQEAEKQEAAKTVMAFLDAAKNGESDEKLMPLVTSKARKVMADQRIPFSARADDMVEYSTGKVELLKEDAARVISTRTDLTDNSQTDYMWMLRREPEGWRIAGLALIEDGKLVRAQDFEDREEMAKLYARLHPETVQKPPAQQPVARQPAPGDPRIRR